ncbi:MAG: type sorting protein [Flavisolibacter sp.]|nr:type sorting protein [Flavisolibacter sp.]
MQTVIIMSNEKEKEFFFGFNTMQNKTEILLFASNIQRLRDSSPIEPSCVSQNGKTLNLNMKNLLLLMLLAVCCGHVNAQCGSTGYTEPQFAIAVQNPACPLVGEITVTSASGGVVPYSYTLMPGNITNATGIFPNVAAGAYQVQMKDACGTIRSRQATVTPYNFTTSSTMTHLGCKNFSFTINCSAGGPALEYGYAVNGSVPIIWGDSSLINLNLEPQSIISLYVRDSCGNQAVSDQIIPKEMMGYIKVLNERIECTFQEIYPEYYGFNAPNVCLYKSPQNTLVECKQAPANYNGGLLTNFFNLPFGQDYYVIVQDSCYRDSAFFKDKTSAGGSQLDPFAWHCTTFDMHSDGNNTDSVCLYRQIDNSLVECKKSMPPFMGDINPATGLGWKYGGAEFYNLPYGSYYSIIYDPCADTLVRIDTTVVYPRNFSSQLNYTCMVYVSAVGVTFDSSSQHPFTTSIYYPDGTEAMVHTSNNSSSYISFPTYPTAGTITVVQQDGCGYKDTSLLYQPMLLPTRTVTYTGGCPGINGNSGGGDILLIGDRYAYGGRGNGAPVATVNIIKRDGIPVNIPQSHTLWNNSTQLQEYYFTNQTTGIYVLESTIGCAGYKVYDTIEVRPYIYPLQNQTNILQCGSNPYVFKDSITGGVPPYTYEIISTNPYMASLITGSQSSNSFSIPPGTNLNTITIQVIDACGNSNTKEFPVNHLGTCYPLPTDSLRIQLQAQNQMIKIYPNPSGKQFYIAFSQKKKTNYQVDVYNATGVKVFNGTFRDVDTRNMVINESLRTGTYIISIIDLKNNRQYYYKQMVQ